MRLYELAEGRYNLKQLADDVIRLHNSPDLSNHDRKWLYWTAEDDEARYLLHSFWQAHRQDRPGNDNNFMLASTYLYALQIMNHYRHRAKLRAKTAINRKMAQNRP